MKLDTNKKKKTFLKEIFTTTSKTIACNIKDTIVCQPYNIAKLGTSLTVTIISNDVFGIGTTRGGVRGHSISGGRNNYCILQHVCSFIQIIRIV